MQEYLSPLCVVVLRLLQPLQAGDAVLVFPISCCNVGIYPGGVICKQEERGKSHLGGVGGKKKKVLRVGRGV